MTDVSSPLSSFAADDPPLSVNGHDAHTLPFLDVGDWTPIEIDNSPRAVADRHLRAEIAERHAASVEAYQAMVALRDVDIVAILARKPQFMDLARAFAAAFHELTESVDTAMQTGVEWRDLITDAGTLRALDIGIERWRQYEIVSYLQAKGRLEEFLN